MLEACTSARADCGQEFLHDAIGRGSQLVDEDGCGVCAGNGVHGVEHNGEVGARHERLEGGEVEHLLQDR